MKTFFVRILILCSCSCSNTPTTTTENPTTPSADDPFILGEETLPPIGCRDWRTKEGKENADC
jgi:hypothetical protein